MALTDNLVSYYKLDGNSTDSVGANNGTDTDITYSTANGKINQGAGFNGTTSKISLGNNFNFNNSFSIGLWIKTSSSSNVRFMGKGISGAFQWEFSVRSNGAIILYLDQASSNTYLEGSSGAGFNDDNWHYVVATYNHSIPSITVYVDGTAGTPGTTTSGSWNTSGDGNCIFGGLVDPEFDGVLDEIGIWSRALSSTEVGQLYNGGSGNQYPFSFIKTINGLAKASVKTINGLAIASVKSVNGLQ